MKLLAKESADIILLEKDLMVLEQGIIEGRKTYANMIKYIKMTASSNFGNMFSGPGVKFCVSVFRQSQEWRWKAGRILA